MAYCRLFPETPGREVAAIFQVDTSYTNPREDREEKRPLAGRQEPVAEPILYGMIGLSPLVHMRNWLSYENATTCLDVQSAFAGAQTRGQIDLVSRLQADASPAVVARGTVVMFHRDATPFLPHISVPVRLLAGEKDTTTRPSASDFM